MGKYNINDNNDNINVKDDSTLFDELGYYDFDTFINKDNKIIGQIPKNFPKEVKFNNLLEEGHDYFQMYIKCDLENANEYVMPNKPFYITNDEEENLFYLINPDNGMTRIELALEIMNWLMMRNAYFNLDAYKNDNEDIESIGIGDYASNLSVHGIINSGRFRNNKPIYNINISS